MRHTEHNLALANLRSERDLHLLLLDFVLTRSHVGGFCGDGKEFVLGLVWGAEYAVRSSGICRLAAGSLLSFRVSAQSGSRTQTQSQPTTTATTTHTRALGPCPHNKTGSRRSQIIRPSGAQINRDSGRPRCAKHSLGHSHRHFTDIYAKSGRNSRNRTHFCRNIWRTARQET